MVAGVRSMPPSDDLARLLAGLLQRLGEHAGDAAMLGADRLQVGVRLDVGGEHRDGRESSAVDLLALISSRSTLRPASSSVSARPFVRLAALGLAELAVDHGLVAGLELADLDHALGGDACRPRRGRRRHSRSPWPVRGWISVDRGVAVGDLDALVDRLLDQGAQGLVAGMAHDRDAVRAWRPAPRGTARASSPAPSPRTARSASTPSASAAAAAPFWRGSVAPSPGWPPICMYMVMPLPSLSCACAPPAPSAPATPAVASEPGCSWFSPDCDPSVDRRSGTIAVASLPPSAQADQALNRPGRPWQMEDHRGQKDEPHDQPDPEAAEAAGDDARLDACRRCSSRTACRRRCPCRRRSRCRR